MSEKNRRIILNTIKRSEDRLFTDEYHAFNKEKQLRNIFMKAVRELPAFVFDTLPRIREIEQMKRDGSALPMLTLCWGGFEFTDAGGIKALPLGPYLLVDRGYKGMPKKYKVALYQPHEKVISSAYRALHWEGRLTDPKKIKYLEEQLYLGMLLRL